MKKEKKVVKSKKKPHPAPAFMQTQVKPTEVKENHVPAVYPEKQEGLIPPVKLDNPIKAEEPKASRVDILNPDEAREVTDSINRGVGFGKNWAAMKDLKSWVDGRVIMDSTEIIFGVKAYRLQAYLEQLINGN